MPLKNNSPFCINHPDTEMSRNEGFSAVTQVIKKGDRVTFNPAAGIPLVVYSCPTCGYVELYVASRTALWEQA